MARVFLEAKEAKEGIGTFWMVADQFDLFLMSATES